jgi:hypothetical protein
VVEKKRKEITKYNFCDIPLQGKLVVEVTPNNDDGLLIDKKGPRSDPGFETEQQCKSSTASPHHVREYN